MKTIISAILIIIFLVQTSFTQKKNGLRGEPQAIEMAQAMVETMGGMDIWAQLKSIHFVHEWYPWNRIDSYIENEILDLTAASSRAERKSEINHQIRAYSRQGKYWTMTNGKLSYASDEVFLNTMKRAPFNFYRLVRAIATNDSFYEIKLGKGDIPKSQRLEFYGPDNVMRGWIILNVKNEPIVKATNEYRYILGPLKRFGNLYIPAWGVYDNGATRYEMITVSASNQIPDSSLFIAPRE